MLECPQFDDVRAQYPDLLQGRSAASGDVRGPPPCSQRYSSTISNKIARKDISSDESLEGTPFSKDETGHES